MRSKVDRESYGPMYISVTHSKHVAVFDRDEQASMTPLLSAHMWGMWWGSGRNVTYSSPLEWASIHALKENRMEDISKNGRVDGSKVHPSTETSKHQTKTVRINLVRTLGNRQRFIATKRQLNQEKRNIKNGRKTFNCLCQPPTRHHYGRPQPTFQVWDLNPFCLREQSRYYSQRIVLVCSNLSGAT